MHECKCDRNGKYARYHELDAPCDRRRAQFVHCPDELVMHMHEEPSGPSWIGRLFELIESLIDGSDLGANSFSFSLQVV